MIKIDRNNYEYQQYHMFCEKCLDNGKYKKAKYITDDERFLCQKHCEEYVQLQYEELNYG